MLVLVQIWHDVFNRFQSRSMTFPENFSRFHTNLYLFLRDQPFPVQIASFNNKIRNPGPRCLRQPPSGHILCRVPPFSHCETLLEQILKIALPLFSMPASHLCYLALPSGQQEFSTPRPRSPSVRVPDQTQPSGHNVGDLQAVGPLGQRVGMWTHGAGQLAVSTRDKRSWCHAQQCSELGIKGQGYRLMARSKRNLANSHFVLAVTYKLQSKPKEITEFSIL